MCFWPQSFKPHARLGPRTKTSRQAKAKEGNPVSPLGSQQDSWELGWVIAQRILLLPKKGSPPGKTKTPAIVHWKNPRGPRGEDYKNFFF